MWQKALARAALHVAVESDAGEGNGFGKFDTEMTYWEYLLGRAREVDYFVVND